MLVRNALAAFVVVVGFTISSGAQEKAVKHVPIRQTSASSGEQMFHTYCAVCHGAEGKGNGPAADALKKPPADLTVLSAKNGGKFPAQIVTNTIRGDVTVPAHGTRDMPIWGNLFSHMGPGGQAEAQLRVANLTKYIESLQAK